MRDHLHFVQQLRLPFKGAIPLALPGIVLVGLPAMNGFPALLLVWDEGLENQGASATHCMDELLTWVNTNWLEFPTKLAVVVQLDSMGRYNHVYPQWPESSRRIHPLITWTPMRWPGCTPCSQASFFGVFSERAQETINIVRTLTHAPENGAA